MDRFVVAVDVDEVLAQYLKGFTAFYNARHGSALQVRDFHTYKFWEVTGGTLEECKRQVDQFHDTEYFHGLEVVPGALEGVARLAALPGVELHVVTSRHAEISEATHRWLGDRFPGFFASERIHVGNHWGSSQFGRMSKPLMCSRIGAKVLIDDSADYCREVAGHGFQAILFDLDGGYGWNQACEDSASVVRVRSWPEVVEQVRRLLPAPAPAPSPGSLPDRAQQPQPGSAAVATAVHFPPRTAEDLKDGKAGRACVPCGECAVS